MNLSRRTLVLSIVAVVCATIVVLLLVEGRSWDAVRTVTKDAEFDALFRGDTLHVKVEYEGPEHLRAHVQQQLTFNVSVSKVDKPASGASAAEPNRTSSKGGAAPETRQSGGSPAENSQDFKDPYLWLRLRMNGAWIHFDDGHDYKFLAKSSAMSPPASYQLTLEPGDDPVRMSFRAVLEDGNSGSSVSEEVGRADLELESRRPYIQVVLPYLAYVFVFVLVASVVFFIDNRMRTAKSRQEAKLAHAKELAEQNPERARYAWQLARTRLESYFDKNLFQVNLVFWVAVIVMTAGFLVVLWGINRAVGSGTAISPGSAIAAGAGVITQFLGATFMVLYRSTMKQANDFIIVLDRINNVGMAMQVLDQIPDTPAELKNDVRAKIIEHLLSLTPAAFAEEKDAAK